MIPVHELAILALASYRGTQLVVHDSLLDVPRDRLDTWHARKPDSTARLALTTLIGCVYCAGWWVSGAFLAVWLAWPDNRLIQLGVLWFALAGGQALLNRWDDSRKDAE
ncbi:DUF1360 domain-containing protein [Streptomyces parvulus]|uniref:DUF1360 domain-containing protein n=1 Tax=Streptomyces parvulus TaxID=146923 RepID=UPI00382FBD73